jgi:S-adenosylmethionine:tRNA ribosyltransferase-isomerase
MADPDLISTYDYDLPPGLIALEPPPTRSGGRLMVVEADRPPSHARVIDLPDLLRPGDLLVFNATRVLPARLTLSRRTGARLEALIIGFGSEGRFDDPSLPAVCLLKGRSSVRTGERLVAPDGTDVELLGTGPHGEVTLRFAADPGLLLTAHGLPPLPPYIRAGRKARGRRDTEDADLDRYQTVFARQAGAVAAPTAGLHFDTPLLDELRRRGVNTAEIVLHVGIGTFRPVDTERLSEHPMHVEHFEVSPSTVEAVAATRRSGGRVVAVGTTVVRCLESAVGPDGSVAAGAGRTRLLIAPGYRFAAVDALFTNFHQPRSTLLALVSALVGVDRILDAYRQAVDASYRFLSYGDAMLILPTRTPEP